MSKKIKKVIYSDGEEKEVESCKTPAELKIEFNYDMDWKANRHFERQFYKIERDILWSLEDETVKDYAKVHLDLKDEDENDCDCEDKSLSDFEDNELMAELSNRNLFGYTNVNIISIDQFTRLSRLITVADNRELEIIISDLEKKYNL